MFSTARKLGALSVILSVINVIGLIMVALYFIGQRMEFHWLFAWLMYLISITVLGVLLTVSIRSFVQDCELESNSTAIQIKKLKERIEELEKNSK